MIFRILLNERAVAEGSRNRRLGHLGQLCDVVHRNRLFRSHFVFYPCRQPKIPQISRSKKADFKVLREVLVLAPILWISLSYNFELYGFVKSISKLLKCISYGCSFDLQQGSFGGDV